MPVKLVHIFFLISVLILVSVLVWVCSVFLPIPKLLTFWYRQKYRSRLFTNRNINAVEKIKICGLYYCSNEDEEYKLNIVEKIKKLSYKIKLWSQRHLTMLL
jgi:hypothetical protein